MESTLRKCEKAFEKLKQCMPQHTLAHRRIKAFRLVLELIEETTVNNHSFAPFLSFTGRAEEALRFYADVLPRAKITKLSELIQKRIEENARVALHQREYESRYTALAERYNAVDNRLADVTAKITDKKTRKALVERFLADLAAQDGLLTEFDESLWTALVDFATVGKDVKVAFTFKNGMEVMV